MSTPSAGNPFDFSRKTVLVTGAAQGIGAGIADRFAAAGAQIVVHYRRSERAARERVAAIHAAGGQAIAVRADVTDKNDVVRLIDQVRGAFGRLDVLVNNAGVYPMAALLDMPEDEWDGVVNANLRSTFLCTQAAARAMKEQEDGGAIVNIASIEAENAAMMHSHYNAAKAGVVMFTEAAAGELGQYGIRVNSVSPGLIWREGIEQAWPEGVERWMNAAPLTRLGRPEDIANACLFLASEAAEWITGANLRVDGGVMTHQIF